MSGPEQDLAALEIGHRLAEAPSELLVRTAFARDLAAQAALQEAIGLADIAHVLMMARLGSLPSDAAGELLGVLLELQHSGEPRELDPALGDVVTNRETRLGAMTKAAGYLGASRARREAITTGFILVLRRKILRLSEALAGLIDTMADLAAAHRTTLFPEYTYLQTAQPTTFGHYVSGYAFPAERDLQRLRELCARLDRCPAGCGSSNGTRLPQDRRMLAELLGFGGVAEHARDAMWQADLPVELASCLVMSAVNLSRLAEDLMVYATGEFGLVELADRHCRASKIMPQKKNPFALAHLRGLANHLLGVQAAITASGRTPSGQIDNRTEAYRELPEALDSVTAGAELMAEILAGLRIDAARCRAVLEESGAMATDFAEGLVALGVADFREAHRITARLVRVLQDSGRRLDQAGVDLVETVAQEELGRPLGVQVADLSGASDFESAIRARTTFGGAAPERVLEAVDELRERVADHRRWVRETAAAMAAAEEALLAEARKRAGGG